MVHPEDVYQVDGFISIVFILVADWVKVAGFPSDRFIVLDPFLCIV